MTQAINGWRELLSVENETEYMLTIHQQMCHGTSVCRPFASLEEDHDQGIINFIGRMLRDPSMPTETVFRLAWQCNVVNRDDMPREWSAVSALMRCEIDLWRAIMTAWVPVARAHVAAWDAARRAEAEAAPARKPVPLEDTIFEREGRSDERDPDLVRALAPIDAVTETVTPVAGLAPQDDAPTNYAELRCAVIELAIDAAVGDRIGVRDDHLAVLKRDPRLKSVPAHLIEKWYDEGRAAADARKNELLFGPGLVVPARVGLDANGVGAMREAAWDALNFGTGAVLVTEADHGGVAVERIPPGDARLDAAIDEAVSAVDHFVGVDKMVTAGAVLDGVNEVATHDPDSEPRFHPSHIDDDKGLLPEPNTPKRKR